jgi:hypothetical protein
MNDRLRNRGGESEWRERSRGSSGPRGPSGNGAWDRPRSDEHRFRAESSEPQYSSAEDETYGSEWDRDPGFGRGGGGDEDRGHSGYARGNAGMYGGGGGGGYVGGRGSSGYGGSTGTDYGRGNFGGSNGVQGRFGNNQGPGYGAGPGYGGSQGRSAGYYGGGAGFSGGREQGFGRERGFGGASDQGFRGRDIPSPGSDLRGGFAGRGPKGYTRTDERIREDVCESLSQDDDVDASEVEVKVSGGEVTLTGTVITRSMKRRAEDIAEEVTGVRDVNNNLKVVKGVLSELKDKLTGDEPEKHFANGGTKSTSASH